MREIIAHLQSSVRDGGRTHIRMARGHGKTSIIKGACVYALAYGFRRFVVAVAARRGDASGIVDDIFALLESDGAFSEDFPEIAYPIAKLGGVLQRSHNQTYKRKRTKINKTAERIVLPTIAGSVSSGAVVMARGFKGATRGLVRGAMRPDLLLFDDLQDDKAAKNPQIVQAYDEMLEKSFMGLGGHDKQIAAFMASTPIFPDDLSELYAQKPNWLTFTYPMVITEPDCWRSADGDPWQEYFAIRKDSIAAGEPEHVAANAFYVEHRAQMDAGSEVLNPDFYDHETELSGIQHAMNLRFANGEAAFDAEYQMRPRAKSEVFHVTAPLVASRVRVGVPQFHIPPETVFTAAATDLNPAYGFSTVMVAFEKNQTAFMPYYAIFSGEPLPIPDALPERVKVQRLTQALVIHGRQIAQVCKLHGIVLNRWGIDCGGKQWAAVCNFARTSKQLCGLGCIPMAGRGGRAWNPNVKSRLTDARNETVYCADAAKGWRWMAFNADFWHETTQRALLGEVGTPGSLSLFDGARHGELAAQIAAEYLEYKVELANGRVDYRWRSTGKHDLGDAATMCYALAGAFGISASGYIPPAAKKKPPVVHGKARYVFKRGRYIK
ncbi:MAG: phage terminase large subunit family protein [Kiritimatiellae bacterium]|nr:phage terminase large subunit family protein [Kiritimatiellia bacterium]